MSEWDVIVVGAGPAGAMSALLLARQGRRVLLVEKAEFPREKVCGCCLGARGARVLQEHGLGEILEDATELHHVEIRDHGRRLRLRIPTGYAISRSSLDQRLVEAARSAGVTFLPRTHAQLRDSREDCRCVSLISDGRQTATTASLVLACDGIHGKLLDDEPGCQWSIAPDAWMGMAVSFDDPVFDSPRDVIAMHVADGGYVGSVRLSNGTLHLAAALEPANCKRQGGPIPAMQAILKSAGVPCLALQGVKAKGTALLTRQRRRYGSRRVLALGDACAYIEPFTGEGMTWAIECAALLTSFLPARLNRWLDDTPQRWQQLYSKSLAREQSLCRGLRFMLHRPRLWAPALRLAQILPAAGQAIAASLDRRNPLPARMTS